MNPNSRSILLRIQEILDGKNESSQVDKVAADYNLLCERTNSRIKQFNKLIQEGSYYAAQDLAQLEPKLTVQIERIRFPRETEWRSFLIEQEIPCFSGFDDGELRQVKDICADPSMHQPIAYKGYRKAILLKDKDGAILHLRKLFKDFPKDLNAKHELTRLETESFAEIDKELRRHLRRSDNEAAVKLVKETVAQDWLIDLKSSAWEEAYKLYEVREHQIEIEELLKLLSQGKVIQRVGKWEDASSIVEKLTEAQVRTGYNELTAVQQNELTDLIKWYRKHELEHDEKARVRESFETFREHLTREATEERLRLTGKREVRDYQKRLEAEWDRFNGLVPELCQKHKPEFVGAMQIVQQRLQKVQKSRSKLKWVGIALLPLVLTAVLFLFWINREEAKIANEVHRAYEDHDLSTTKSTIGNWDDFVLKFKSSINPFRHYSSHRMVGEVKQWVNETDMRLQKVDELMAKIDFSPENPPNRTELRRIRLNYSIVEELLDKLPGHTDPELLERAAKMGEDISVLHAAQVEVIRMELTEELFKLTANFNRYFPVRKTDFSDVQTEINIIHDQIDDLETKFRQSFETESVEDLRIQLDDLKKRLISVEEAYTKLRQLDDRLRESIAISEYVDYLEQISNLPFPYHPLISQALKLTAEKEKIENLAQQLLLPNNPIGWNQFLGKSDQSLIATETNKRALDEWQKLVGHTALRDIYRYRVYQYKNGIQQPDRRVVYTHGEIKRVTDSSQTTARTVITVNQFSEALVGRVTAPFEEQVYTCELNAGGLPVNGTLLELDRLTPESGFFRQIDTLCGYDQETKLFEEPLLEVIDEVKRNTFITPIFKSWVLQQMFNYIIVRPFDWGLNFTPTAQVDYRNLQRIKGTLYPYDWLRKNTKDRLLQPLNSYFSSIEDSSYFKQAVASRELFTQIARQRVRYGGYVNENGIFILLKSTPKNRKLFGMKPDGTIGLLRKPGDSETPPTQFEGEAFSPILFFNDPPEVILNRVTRKTGVDVNSEEFRPFLPQIFL